MTQGCLGIDCFFYSISYWNFTYIFQTISISIQVIFTQRAFAINLLLLQENDTVSAVNKTIQDVSKVTKTIVKYIYLFPKLNSIHMYVTFINPFQQRWKWQKKKINKNIGVCLELYTGKMSLKIYKISFSLKIFKVSFSLFNSISPFGSYLMRKPSFEKNSSGTT